MTANDFIVKHGYLPQINYSSAYSVSPYWRGDMNMDNTIWAMTLELLLDMLDEYLTSKKQHESTNAQ